MAIDFAQAPGLLAAEGCIPTLAQILAWVPRATRKRHFTVTVGSFTPFKVPFSAGRIASAIVPAGAVWVGGDSSVTTTGPSGGIPLTAGQPFTCGLEEGDSDTWLIAAAGPVTVACMEFLPT
jgi:hypothetical protein